MVKIGQKRSVIGLLLIVVMLPGEDMRAMVPVPLNYEATVMQKMSLVDQASLVVQQPLSLEQIAAQDDRLLTGADVAMQKYRLKKKPRVVNEAYLFDALERQADRDEDSLFFACCGLGELPSCDDLEPSTWWQVYFVIESQLRDYIPAYYILLEREAIQWQINRLLLYGADFNNKELVAVSICAGADTHIRNKWGQSAFDIARNGGHAEIIGVLEIAKQLPSQVRLTLEDDNLEDDNFECICFGDNICSYCAAQSGDDYCAMSDFESAAQADRY